MIYVAIASVALAAVGLAVAAVGLHLAFGHMQRQDREHKVERGEWAAERRDLNDRLAHAAGRPWTLPEAPEQPEPEPIPDYAFLPEQGPDT